jgi:hypothetical protein
MDPYAIGPVIVTVTLILTVGGVILLRPITKYLAAYLQVLTEQRGTSGSVDSAELHDLLSRVDARLDRLEERQLFAEQLLDTPDGRPHRISPVQDRA